MDAREILRRAGLEPTTHRVQVLDCLARAGRALTPQEILDDLGPDCMNRVTLYRILDLFQERGLALRHNAGERAFRYCLGQGRTAQGHGHFHCNRCGRLDCLPPQVLDLEALTRGLDLHVEHAEIHLDGVCPSCLKAGA
jgi:Fur family ferric uptake transcriptional regulator